MDIKKVAYFYFKLENDITTEYPEGWFGWYFDYFKHDTHVPDNNGNDIIAPKNSVYIVPPNTPMYFKYDNVDSFVHTCILFEADSEEMAKLELPYRTPIIVSDISGFEQLLHDMQDCQTSSSRFSEREQELYIERILLFLHDDIYKYKKSPSVPTGDDLNNIRNIVMNSLAFPWNIQKMASVANMSVSSFQRQYKKLYDKTPIADLYDMRFNKAKMLLETGFSISYVLNSCCFKSLQHFSMFFKEREGISPSEYKKKFKNTGSSYEHKPQ